MPSGRVTLAVAQSGVLVACGRVPTPLSLSSGEDAGRQAAAGDPFFFCPSGEGLVLVDLDRQAGAAIVRAPDAAVAFPTD